MNIGRENYDIFCSPVWLVCRFSVQLPSLIAYVHLSGVLHYIYIYPRCRTRKKR
ncbi:uncharacterized protein BDW43DRAFT_270734 [Aspergillus alliaceus]|uniref:uncharacterized protein n=1 Tax=Petromyces alliaceus TaxID=209559 RepID=UPI0012A4D461|nr:uncharacterized protein BDW43DRAFT_270734 [Aspergillus alliaceus]KAB8235051.1 hypothetical protein BDW43DRAFT_270734 [Aspergillus alliaceus]